MASDVEILVLDDEPIVGKRLKPALEKFGYKVESFESPIEAMKRLDEKEFDIVITDIYMENIDGIQILEHVKKVSPRSRVIMITGYAMMEVARKAMEKGAFDFIAKPFTPDELRAIVAKAISQE